MMSVDAISQLIRSRRSIYTEMYAQQAIPKEIIETILENAIWAPTHKKTEPWRFLVYHSEEARKSLSDLLLKNYLAASVGEDYSPVKENKVKSRPLQAGVAIVLILQRHKDSGLPEWEEVAALACGVQNMYLTATAAGLGCYWSTPNLITDERDFFDLEDHETCLGVFYAGYLKADLEFGSNRKPLSEKALWF
ncbi:MAG: nitroreductase [Saprospiraceae bacterium]|nr:nitroreductase [Saprospiraceae bacterium]